MRARVVIVGTAGAVEQLTYAVPPALEGRVECGQRVLVPMRSRRLTGLITAIGPDLDSGGVEPREILELLEARPLFDRAHLELIEFLASYYMAPLAEAYRNVIPAVARVESRLAYKAGAAPMALARATMSALESAIVAAVTRRPMTARQLKRLGARTPHCRDGEAEAAIARLLADGLIERHDGTRGRHRETAPPLVRLYESASAPAAALRGTRQRAIVEHLQVHGATRLDALEAAIADARTAIPAMARRGIVEIIADSAIAAAAEPSALGESRASLDNDSPAAQSPFELSVEQAAAVAAALPAVRDRRFETYLLWGVTASGKTEVYLRLAAEALAANRRVLVLVPEIALADQVVRAFRARFGALVGIAHSAQNVAERWASWMAALSGDSRIMIGPRSVVFAPLPDPGLIVVDEEHDSAYKSEEGIRYNARDLAVALGRFAKCPVVLGSATPSAESYVNTRRGRYRMLRLGRRVGDRALAAVEIVDLREHLRAEQAKAEAARTNELRGATASAAVARVAKPLRAHGDSDADAAQAVPGPTVAGGDAAPDQPAAIPLSATLIEALRTNLATGGQSMVFLNRRGYHNFLQCHLCGNVIACLNCSVSMTFHLRDRSLRCHYCGENAPAPDKCPACDGYGLAGQGFGTERLVQTLAELVPAARIERMDSDSSGRRGARAAILARLARGEIDIIVGTQMITKGFDFPGVTLVGVVMADLALNMPDFRSAERTFQLLTQVAGRAGRGERPGRVLIQTYAPFHYSIRAARDQDYARFIRRELELRRELMYPPFARLALVRIEGADAARVSAIASRVAAALGRHARPASMRILGPAPAPIERIKRRYRWQVVLKAQELNEMRAALGAMRAEIATAAAAAGVHVIIDVDPINML